MSDCAVVKRRLSEEAGASPAEDPNLASAAEVREGPAPKRVRLLDEEEDGGGAKSEEKDESTIKRERLLFLLQVASDPRVAGLGGDAAEESEASSATRSLPSLLSSTTASTAGGSGGATPPELEGGAPAPSPGTAPAPDDEDEDEEAKQRSAKLRRIQFALSVLNAPTAENEARLRSVLEETEAEATGKAAAAAASTNPALAPAARARAPTTRKRHHTRKRTFAEKLMDVLSKPEAEQAITWLPNGNSFVIVSPARFTSDVLPKYFKSAKFESFTRKLNRWGFKRITKGTNAVAYSHELFRRDSPEVCKQMKGDGKQRDASEASPGSGGSSPDGSRPAPPPLPEKAVLEEELKRELEVQRRLQRQSELRPRPEPAATVPAAATAAPPPAGPVTNGAREAASALNRLSASYPSGTAHEPQQRRRHQQTLEAKPTSAKAATTILPKKNGRLLHPTILPKPKVQAVDHTLAATLKETSSLLLGGGGGPGGSGSGGDLSGAATSPYTSLASMLSRLDQHASSMNLTAAASASAADHSSPLPSGAALSAAAARAHQSRSKLQFALRGHHGHHHGFSSDGLGGADLALYPECGLSGPSPALAMYYNRKMQQITARYSAQLGGTSPSPSCAAPLGGGAETSPSAQHAAEEGRSYLHRIRQNLSELR